MKIEKVNHPNHYNIEGKKECIIEIVEKFGIYVASIFCLSNAYKYLYRAGNKVGESQFDDISKAKWYFDWVFDRRDFLTAEKIGNDNFDTINNLYNNIKEGLKQYE